jgi:hypothetical protein
MRGKTPMVELARISRGLPGRILAILEMRNPCSSVKDRLGLALIEDAERNGRLKSGATIVEATGGNTGIGLHPPASSASQNSANRAACSSLMLHRSILRRSRCPPRATAIAAERALRSVKK